MSSLPAHGRRLPARWPRAAGYAAGALAAGACGWLVAGISDAALLSATAVLALCAALALAAVGVRTYTLASPIMLLGLPLLLSLSAAMLPITRIFGDWTPGNLGAAVAIVLAPLAGVGAGMLVTGQRVPHLEPGTAAGPRPNLLLATCVLMCVLGTVAYVVEWSSIGGPPLLSPNIDKARFALDVGAFHLLTQGIPLALLIAMWARVGHPQSFTAPQRRVLEAVICFVPLVLVLGGGRSFVLIPLITALVVSARYLSRRAAHRLMIVIPVAVLAMSSAIFIARLGQQAPNPVVGSVLYNDTGARSSPLESAYRALSINLGEQLRVIAELRDANVEMPPFTTSIWFAHNLFDRAVDPNTIVGPNAGGWLTSTYAGPLLMDFGLPAALAFGLLMGVGAHLLYLAFARGRSVTVIWVYAYLAAPIALSFYLNIFLYFAYPIVDVTALIVLSRLLVARAPS